MGILGFLLGVLLGAIILIIILGKNYAIFAKPDTDVIRWINATHGILTCINNKNVQIYAGVPVNKKNSALERNTLKEYWDIVNRDGLLSMVDKLMNNSGDNEDENVDYKEVAAWDYSRALSLLSSGYLAGYLNREEALEKSLNIARVCQKQYSSWDDFMEAYFKGYTSWSGDSGELRKRAYEGMKKRSNSIYNLPWNLEIKKDW